MLSCSTCPARVLELFELQCEPCYRKTKIEPLVALRAAQLTELSRIDGLLTAKLEKLAKSSRHNLNMSFTCVCGERHKSGLEMIAHLPDCKGAPRPATSRNGYHSKALKTDFSDLEEIG